MLLRIKFEVDMNKLLLVTFLVILSSCENVSKTDFASAESPFKETIVRKKQRVIRYNCKGEIQSDKVESLNGLWKIYTIEPKVKTNLFDFVAVNKTTGSKAGRLGVFKTGVFTLDLAPTLFNINAVEGLNVIDWSFHYCSKPIENHGCSVKTEVKESGTFYIDIKYEVEFINEIDEVRPSKEECKS